VKAILSLVLSLVLLGLAGLAIKLALDTRASKDAAALAAEMPSRPRPTEPVKPAKTDDPQPAPVERRPPPRGHNPFVTDGTGRFADFGAATNLVAAEIFDSCLDRPTLVVWLIDATESAADLRRQVNARLAEVYPTLDRFQFGPSADAVAEPWLVSVVGSFAGTTDFVTPEPTADSAVVVKAAASFGEDSSGDEHTFAAIADAVEHFAPLAEKEHRRMMIVVATDETGDDDQRVDELVTLLRKRAIPLYVIGVPAPFGSHKSLSGLRQVEAFRPVRQGPESLETEVLNLGGWQTDWQPVDSGFGPFALSRLALTSGGRYLAVRQMNSYDPATMAAYTPDYLSRAGYDELVQSNRARRALVDGARQSRIDMGGRLENEFVKTDEAGLKKMLDGAQRAAARLEPKLQALYAVIEAGAADAPQLGEPRWQAGYDLALGRVAAARARIEGYNAALAQMKAGRAFPDPKHTTWVLKPTDEVKGDSTLEKLADQARKCLGRVRTQHPDTPWATQAARELANPMGWQWVSQ
jgi:von Willebrand factor type A domain-containing protein